MLLLLSLRWSSILNEVCADLSACSEASSLFCCLMVLRKLVGVYEFRGRDSRKALDGIIDAAWPLLLPAAAKLLQQAKPEDAELITLFKLALKIYWSSTQLCLSNSPLLLSTMDSWFEMLSACIRMPGI